GVLEASTTQNDYVHACWIVGFVTFGLEALDTQTKEARKLAILIAGAFLGLAVLTKGTTYVIAAPFVVWFVIQMIRLHGRATIGTLAAALAIVIVLSACTYARNWR